MAYIISTAQVAPYVPVQEQIFRDAFIKNYRKARYLQRDSVFWFTSSRNYRFLTAIAVAALLVLGAAICQLKAADYSSLFIHRTGANFVWSMTSLIFCAIEFARLFRHRDGYWTWETACAMWLAVSIVISGLAVATNVAGTMNLAPGVYRTEQTTPYPFYYGMTTGRWPESTTPNSAGETPSMTTGLIMNEWDTYQWTNWRKAVFVLYCFCTIVQGSVLICCYLPYVFFKIHEYKLGYGRRLLSNGQIYDVTKNAYRAYKAAVYNRDRLQQIIDDRVQPSASPIVPGGFSQLPPMEDGDQLPPGVQPASGAVYPPGPPSSVSSGNFKHACQHVKPRKSAWFPVFEAPPTSTRKTHHGRSTYYSYDDDYSYYYSSTTPSYTSSNYYYTSNRRPTSRRSNYYSTYSSRPRTRTSNYYDDEQGQAVKAVVRAASVASSGRFEKQQQQQQQQQVRRPRLVAASSTRSYDRDDEDAETFTEYIPVGGGTTTADYTTAADQQRRTSIEEGATTSTERTATTTAATTSTSGSSSSSSKNSSETVDHSSSSSSPANTNNTGDGENNNDNNRR